MAKTKRAPIVTILGHVDSGKTSLLDAIRKTDVAAKEEGGITQSIRASQVITKEGKKITFIDTPGHSAFSQMRSRGATLSDIAVLVVAGDSGVAPQTKESLEYIQEANVPFVVAVTKVDLATSNKQSVVSQLEKEGVLFEGRGGNTPCVYVSSKTGEGVSDLLEVITLVSEINETSADPEGSLEAVVVETRRSKRGNLVSAVIREGSVKCGQEIFSESNLLARVRALVNDKGENVKEAGPGDAVQILGFDKLPPVGSVLGPGGALPGVVQKRVKETREGVLNLVLRAETTGALEALEKEIPKGLDIISTSIGDVNESDIFLAKTTGSTIVGFGVKVGKDIVNLAKSEGVEIMKGVVIYELTKELEKLVKKDVGAKILGRAEIVRVFESKQGKIAGGKVVSGRITKGDKIEIVRGKIKLADVRIASLRQVKEDVNSASEAQEFGVTFTSPVDFREGDVLVSVRS